MWMKFKNTARLYYFQLLSRQFSCSQRDHATIARTLTFLLLLLRILYLSFGNKRLEHCSKGKKCSPVGLLDSVLVVTTSETETSYIITTELLRTSRAALIG